MMKKSELVIIVDDDFRVREAILDLLASRDLVWPIAPGDEFDSLSALDKAAARRLPSKEILLNLTCDITAEE